MSGMYTFFRMFFNVHFVFVWKMMKEIDLLSYGTWKVAALWWLMYTMWWQHRSSKRNNSFTKDDIPQWWKNLACFTRQKHEEGEKLTNNERKKCIITARQQSCGKVIFSHKSLSVILFRRVPCDHYPWCIGPHHIVTSGGWLLKHYNSIQQCYRLPLKFQEGNAFTSMCLFIGGGE